MNKYYDENQEAHKLWIVIDEHKRDGFDVRISITKEEDEHELHSKELWLEVKFEVGIRLPDPVILGDQFVAFACERLGGNDVDTIDELKQDKYYQDQIVRAVEKAKVNAVLVKEFIERTGNGRTK